MPPAQAPPSLGSFPLLDEETLDLDLEGIDFTAIGSTDTVPQDASNTLPKLSPGHHRSSLLLDGLACTSSAHSSPVGSFDGSSAQQAPAQQPTAAAAATCSTAGQDSLRPTTAAAADLTAAAAQLGALASPAGTAAGQQLQQQQPVPPTAAAGNSSSTGLHHHPAPGALQLPDFAAFMLPEECAFTESSMDDGLTTPTPHTPVVQNMFAADCSLPVSSVCPTMTHHLGQGYMPAGARQHVTARASAAQGPRHTPGVSTRCH